MIMEIDRYGSERYRGITSVIGQLPLKAKTGGLWTDNVSWNESKKKIEILAPRVPFGDGHTRHNYLIRLTLEDVSALITILGHAGSASGASLLRTICVNKYRPS